MFSGPEWSDLASGHLAIALEEVIVVSTAGSSGGEGGEGTGFWVCAWHSRQFTDEAG